MSDLSTWLDSMCSTFGFGGEPAQAESGGMQKAAEKIQRAAHEHRLENLSPEACETGTPGADPYDPKAERSRAGIRQRAQALKPRIDAVTRKVHRLVRAGETRGGRPEDPALLAVYNEQIDLGSRISALLYRFDSFETSDAENRLITAEWRMNDLECKVAAL